MIMMALTSSKLWFFAFDVLCKIRFRTTCIQEKFIRNNPPFAYILAESEDMIFANDVGMIARYDNPRTSSIYIFML